MNSSGTSPQRPKASFKNQLADVGTRTLGLAFLFGSLGGGVLGILTLAVMWLFSSGGETPPPAAPAAPATPVAANASGGDAAEPGTPSGAAAPAASVPDPSTPRVIAEKLRLIALAMHNHHDRFRGFPVQSKKEWLDDQGRPKLSWRVHLLQFLDQRPLYDLFHLDEPWDSVHNKPLAEKMPDIYRSVPDDGNVTRMHVLSGDTMLFRPGRVPKIADCRDGASQTVMIVHAGVDRADGWTKPDNPAFDPDHPLAALGDLRSRGLQAAMVDGKVWTFPPDLTEEEFLGLATPNGGEVVDVSSVARRRELGIPPPKPTRTGATPAAGATAKAVAPAGDAATEARNLQAAAQKLKRIGLGMLDFHDTFRRYPPPDNKSHLDPQGRPFLSWRVHLLRFLDQEPLYKQFKLNEPWDSEHNRTLLGKMPDLYREVDDPPDSTTTRVLAFTGPNTAFPGGVGIRIPDMRDGTWCTILLVRAGNEKAVPWTKPEDVAFDEAAPRGGCGVPSGEVLQVVMADISVRQLSPSIPNDVFKALVTPAGGEKLDQFQLQEFGFR